MRPDSTNDVDWQSLLIAGFGATCALLTWLVIGALTGLGKSPSLLFPSAALVALIGALVGLTRAAIVLWIATAAALLAFCVIAMTSFVTRVLPTSAMVRQDNLPAGRLDAVVVLSGGITPDGLLFPEALDRLLTGLALMRDSVAPVLVVTEPRRSRHGVRACARRAPISDAHGRFGTHDAGRSRERMAIARGEKCEACCGRDLTVAHPARVRNVRAGRIRGNMRAGYIARVFGHGRGQRQRSSDAVSRVAL